MRQYLGLFLVLLMLQVSTHASIIANLAHQQGNVQALLAAQQFKIVHRSGLVLNIWGGYANSLTQVRLYPWEASRNEIWTWNGDNVDSVLKPGMVLNVRGGLGNGNDLIIYPITRGVNELITFKYGALILNGFCLTTSGKTNVGAVVVAVPLGQSCLREWNIVYL